MKKVVLSLVIIALLSISMLSSQSRSYVYGTIYKDTGLTWITWGYYDQVEIYLIPNVPGLPPVYLDTVSTNSSGVYYYYIDPIMYPPSAWSKVWVVAGMTGYSNSEVYSYDQISVDVYVGKPQ